jgi:error-prone DNA polymerase
VLAALWHREGIEAVREQMALVPEGFAAAGVEGARPGAAESRSTRPVMARPQSFGDQGEQYTAGGMGRRRAVPEGGEGRAASRRVLVHSSGFAMSPYSDIKPAGEDTRDVARKLWHRSPGSAG